MRIPIRRPRPDQRPRHTPVDQRQLEKARERAWLESTRYRVTL